MTANLALASQGYAEQIAKQAGAVKQVKEPQQSKYAGARKQDLANIFETEAKTKIQAAENTEAVKPVAVQEKASIFDTPAAQSQHKAAEVAHKADLQNYDAGKIGAKFGGVA